MLSLSNWSDKALQKKPQLLIQTLGFDTVVSAHNWAFEKYSKWLGNLTNTQYKTLYYYCLSDYKKINSFLRNPEAEKDLALQEKINNLSQCLKTARVPENIIVYRGIDVKNIEDYSDYVGKNFIEKGFLSTSMVKSIAKRFAKNVLLKITVPRGSSGAYIGTISEKLEAEILFDKNQCLKITDINRTLCLGGVLTPSKH